MVPLSPLSSLSPPFLLPLPSHVLAPLFPAKMSEDDFTLTTEASTTSEFSDDETIIENEAAESTLDERIFRSHRSFIYFAKGYGGHELTLELLKRGEDIYPTFRTDLLECNILHNYVGRCD